MSRLPEDIFNDALELAADDRASFLDRACGPDDGLRLEVEALLNVAGDHPGLLEFAGSPSVPERIGRYRVLGLCGTGGMGTVYRAQDSSLGRTVAIKVLTSGRLRALDGLRPAPNAHDRLEREARCLAALNHLNVATIHSLEYEGDRPFLVMEYVVGRTLADLLASGASPVRERLRICRDVARAVEAAHDRGIVHRDLKPANVMVTEAATVKVLDFGIAKVMEMSESPEETHLPAGNPVLRATLRAGTPGYMSPEQSRGESVDRRSDIWAVGRLLCDCFGLEKLCRESPLLDDGADAAAEESPSSVPAVPIRAKGLPPPVRRRLERLAARCLEDDPDGRPASMREVRGELEKILTLQRSLSAKGKWLWVGGVLIFLATAFVTYRYMVQPRDLPAAARVLGRNVEVRYVNGAERLFQPPAGMAQDLDSALVVTAGEDGAGRLVIAWTGNGAATESRLLVWERTGRLLRVIPATEDWPYGPAAGGPPDIYLRKRFALMFPPTESSGCLVAVEYARYFPCVLRSLRLSTSAVRETYRLYHAGQVNKVLFSSGLDPESKGIWLTGRVRDGGILRETANGVEQNTHFLACFPVDGKGTEFFPPWTEPDSVFLTGHTGKVDAARPQIYFVLRGVDTSAGLVNWTESQPLWIDQVFQPDPETIGLLLSNTIRIDLHREGRSRVDVEATATGTLASIMAQRADALRAPADSVLRSFLADSVIALAAADERLNVTGDFRDIRAQLPPPWKSRQ